MTTIDHYDQFVDLMGDFATGYTGWPNDQLGVMLMNSSHVRTVTNTVRTEVNANELSTGFGYTQSDGALGGKALASVTSVNAAGVWTLDAGDVTWAASGGTIGPSTDAVIFDDTITSPLNPLLFDIDFEASESAGTGTNFVIAFDAAGICTIT